MNTNVTNTVDGHGIARETQVIVEVGGRMTDASSIHGRVAGVNTLSFESVKLPLSGPDDVITVRLGGIRANAFPISYKPDGKEAISNTSIRGLAGVHDVLAFVKIESVDGTSFAIADPQIVVGTTYPGFEFSTGVIAFDPTVVGKEQFTTAFHSRVQAYFACTFQENFPDAFKNRTQEAYPSSVEPLSPDTNGATNGTLLGLHFLTVPDGVTIYVTTSNLTMQSAPSAQLRSPETSAGEIDGPIGKMVPLTKTNQSATAVWEWVAEDPKSAQRVDTVSFGVAVVAKSG